MRYYLKHLLELYGEYMSVALVGLFMSALVLSSYSAMRSGSIVLSIVGTLVLLFSLRLGLNVVKHRYWSWRETRVLLKEQRGALALNELIRLEEEAHSEGNKERLEEARRYLRFLQARGIRDYRESGDERLIKDVVVLLEQLHAENVSEASISQAVDKFVTSMEQSGKSVVFPADRNRIIGSIVSDTVTNENKDRKFVS